MQTAIATVCLSGTLPEKIDAIAAARFKGIEIFENDLLSFNGTPRDARRLIEDAGLVRTEKVGRSRVCTAVPQPLDDVRTWTESYRRMLDDRFDRLAELLERTKGEPSA